MVALASLAAALASSVFVLLSSAHSIRRNPVAYVTLVDDAVIGSPSHRVHADSHFDLTFTLHDGRNRFRLALEPNHDIVHDDFTISYLDSDGSVRETQTVPRSHHRVYRGHAFVERPDMQGWSKAGWARITVHRDGDRPIFEGTFRVDGNHHNVVGARQYLKLRHERDPVLDADVDVDSMVVWRDSDVMDDDDDDDDDDMHAELKRDLSSSSNATTEQRCDAGSLRYNMDKDNNYHDVDAASQSSNPLHFLEWRSLVARQNDVMGGGPLPGANLGNSIGSLDGCPTTKKVALVGIATDCTYWDGFNSREEIRTSVINMVNQASQLYESTFKISIGIRNLTISDKNCPGTPPASAPWNIGCGDQFTITDRLNAFSHWRGQLSDNNAYWTLLTRCATGSAVGLAWRGQLCRVGLDSNRDTNETVASANVVVRTDTEWQIFAHESGHMFGASHDCTRASCAMAGGGEMCCPLSRSSCNAEGKFIMNPTTGKDITQFSPCSIGNICSGFKTNLVKASCLTDNKDVKTITDSQCGNGIVESGEDCDCGGEQGCRGNRCCDAKTCKFTSGSVCDPANEDCCGRDCRFAAKGTVCRASTGVCDLAEVCTGDGAGCPADHHNNDGDSCGDGLNCASGQCTSRDMQCRAVASSLRGLNTTQACPGSGCSLSCLSADTGLDSCITLNQNFLDGSLCGGGGKCVDGQCKGASTLKEIGSWLHDHKAILIPVISIIGGLIVVAIITSVIGSLRRRIRRRNMIQAAKESSAWPSDASRASPHPTRQPGPLRQWSDSMASNEALYTGHGHPQWPLAPPPPSYERPSQEALRRTRSERYA
ncbi:disintegrin-like metalloprotease [Ophiocordyceps camponoti-floridani]|uniref:Disintegrin and metalloproteinase domain-containing protein B n=1 Tax=Ophiocordyceps camponoti-floridani TaxID=2030778 RepID=A0A8H4VB08_9HYPO|nr:disintegrin-like metalloprotease [Ophiocordyceps camponoti-floridani]